MSSHNKNGDRHPKDFYVTPDYTIDSLLNNINIPEGVIFEPSAGNGALIKALKRHGYTNPIIANEIRAEENINLKIAGAIRVMHKDYLELDKNLPYDDIKTVITNPPFSLALEFMEKTLELFPKALIIMLFPCSIYGSKKRKNFWQTPGNMNSDTFFLSKRPSFTGGGTNSMEYMWCIWNGPGKGNKVID